MNCILWKFTGGPPPSGQMGQLPPGAPPHPNNRPPIDGLPPPGPPPGAPPGPPPSAGNYPTYSSPASNMCSS